MRLPSSNSARPFSETLNPQFLIIFCPFLTAALLLVGCASTSPEDASQQRTYHQWRQTTASILNQSDDATFAGVSLYLDGGSLGYFFTNQLGIITAFIPHPGIDNKEMGLVRNQRIFLGQPESGLNGIEVKRGSNIDRNLKILVQIAASKNIPPEYRAELDKFTNILATRQFEWKHSPRRITHFAQNQRPEKS